MTFKKPLISVILPCYNAHRFLGQALASVRAQSFCDYEVIVIDDGSTDPGTQVFLKALPDDVRVVRQENRGLSGARNTGFREARGDYVLPLDCDDWLEPNALEKMLQALKEHPQATFAFAHIQMEGEGCGILSKHYNFFEQLFLNQMPYCLLLRKSAWQAVGGYDESMRWGYEDWEFNIRLGKSGFFGVVVPEPLFHYRIAQTGMLLSISTQAHADLWQSIRKKHSDVYRPVRLFCLWRDWRIHSSTYPLWLFFPWWVAAVLLPNKIFSRFFGFLRQFSHGRRVTSATRQA